MISPERAQQKRSEPGAALVPRSAPGLLVKPLRLLDGDDLRRLDTDSKISSIGIELKNYLGILKITGHLTINFVKTLTSMNKIYWTVMAAMSLFIALGLFLAASATQKREARMTMQRHLLDLSPR